MTAKHITIDGITGEITETEMTPEEVSALPKMQANTPQLPTSEPTE